LRAKTIEHYGQSLNLEHVCNSPIGSRRWHIDLVKEEAGESGLTVIEQNGNLTVDDLCEKVLQLTA